MTEQNLRQSGITSEKTREISEDWYLEKAKAALRYELDVEEDGSWRDKVAGILPTRNIEVLPLSAEQTYSDREESSSRIKDAVKTGRIHSILTCSRTWDVLANQVAHLQRFNCQSHHSSNANSALKIRKSEGSQGEEIYLRKEK